MTTRSPFQRPKEMLLFSVLLNSCGSGPQKNLPKTEHVRMENGGKTHGQALIFFF